MTNQRKVSRRGFLWSSAAGAAAAGLSTLTARSYGHVIGANERLRVGIIGLGVMGEGHLGHLLDLREPQNLEVISLCDVYQPRVDYGVKMVSEATGKEPQATMRFEEVLGSKDVDVVLVATPDHWHAKLAIDLLREGKHVYCEKPMCHTIEQAKQLLDTVNSTDRLCQVGVQSCSLGVLDQVREFIQKGGIGKLVLAQSAYNRNNLAGQWRDYGDYYYDVEPGPELDWDTWLGYRWDLAPQRPWHPPRFFQFRCYWDYSGGVATDLFFHQLAHLIKATGVQFPERVVAAGGIWVFNKDRPIPEPGHPRGEPDDREVPDMYNMMIDYPGGPTVWLVGSMVNDMRDENEQSDVPEVIGGYEATIYLDGNSAKVVPQPASTGKKRSEVIEIKGEKGEGGQRAHWANLFDCIRNSSPKKLNCPVELGYRTNVPITMGVMAYRQQKVMRWDAERQVAVPA